MESKSFLNSILNFYLKPKLINETKFSLKFILHGIALAGFMSIFAIILIQIIISSSNMEINNSVQDLIFSDIAIWQILILVSILAPLLEEIFFRLPLSTNKEVWSIWLIILPILTYYFFRFEIILAWIIISIIIISSFIFLVIPKQETFLKRYNLIYPYLIYLSALIFGLIHLGNYQGLELSGMSLAFVLPQISVGFVLVFIRVRLGFWISVFFHFVWNTAISLFLIILFPIFKNFTMEELETITPENLSPDLQIRFLASGGLVLFYFLFIVAGMIWIIFDYLKYKDISSNPK